jgi:hypothetical protein
MNEILEDKNQRQYIIKNNFHSLDNLEKFLENEKSNNATEPWSKLDKTAKLKKLINFADNYKLDNNLSDEEYDKLINFLKECLDRKKLQRVKDVIYDKTTGLIKSVPALCFNKTTNHFTLKNIDKRISTIKSLAPKKTQKTIKNKVETDNTDSDCDN